MALQCRLVLFVFVGLLVCLFLFVPLFGGFIYVNGSGFELALTTSFCNPGVQFLFLGKETKNSPAGKVCELFLFSLYCVPSADVTLIFYNSETSFPSKETIGMVTSFTAMYLVHLPNF